MGYILSLLLFSLSFPHTTVQHRKSEEQSTEVCKGATYFILHGHHAPWTKHKKLLCRIGNHDFYGDKKEGKK